MLHPVIAPHEHHCPLIEALGFLSRSNRWNDFFFDSQVRGITIPVALSSCVGHSCEVGLLPGEISMIV